MSSTRLLQTFTCLLALLAAGCAIAPSPTPDDYRILYPILQGKLSCGLVMPPGVEVKEVHISPGAGSDTVIVAPPKRLVLFDTSSPTTAEEHDTIVLRWTHPTGYRFRRVGPHLLICGTVYWTEILLIRHYCFDATVEPHWNNQFEEIAFPHARETWLADDIYDALGTNQEFPGVERIRDRYEFKEHAKAAAEGWRVRPFREVLPLAWFAATSCDEDLATVSTK